jgi:hypothetical protein
MIILKIKFKFKIFKIEVIEHVNKDEQKILDL